MKSVNWCGIDLDYNRFEYVSYVKLNIPFCYRRTVFSSAPFILSLSIYVSVSLSFTVFSSVFTQKVHSLEHCIVRVTHHHSWNDNYFLYVSMRVFYFCFAILIYLPLNASDPCKWSNLIKTSKHFHSSNEI